MRTSRRAVHVAKRLGWHAELIERHESYGKGFGRHVDPFSADVLAVSTNGLAVLIQATGGTDIGAHLLSTASHPGAKAWVEAGMPFLIWSFRRIRTPGGATRWQVREHLAGTEFKRGGWVMVADFESVIS